MRPNFFIVGAPKSGTTSLATWLSEHPHVFMSRVKEPNYFSSDFIPNLPRNQARYEQLFQAADERQRAIGEASTGYLYSRAAVPAILEYNPDSKFIVMVRNPLEMVVSLHQQRVFEGNENITDFEVAWSLQGRRASGLDAPQDCHDPRLLEYGPICRVGEQIERLYSQAPGQQVLIVFLEDVKADTRFQYRRVLEFLEVDDDGRTDFGALNVAKKRRLKAMHKTVRNLVLWKQRVGLPKFNTGFASAVDRFTSPPVKLAPLSRQMRDELREYFASDIARISHITGRPLAHWME